MTTVGTSLAALLDEMSRLLVEALLLAPTFQRTPQKPGQQFGMVALNSWSTPNTDQAQTNVTATLWVVNGATSYYDCAGAQVLLVAAIDSFLPSLQTKVDRRKILQRLTFGPTITPTIRVPIVNPNHTGELYIGDIVCPLTLTLAISRDQSGQHF